VAHEDNDHDPDGRRRRGKSGDDGDSHCTWFPSARSRRSVEPVVVVSFGQRRHIDASCPRRIVDNQHAEIVRHMDDRALRESEEETKQNKKKSKRLARLSTLRPPRQRVVAHSVARGIGGFFVQASSSAYLNPNRLMSYRHQAAAQCTRHPRHTIRSQVSQKEFRTALGHSIVHRRRRRQHPRGERE
jgi:hypothetical protein